jgi:hypothetical protein
LILADSIEKLDLMIKMKSGLKKKGIEKFDIGINAI